MTCTGGPTAISRRWLQPRRDRTGPPAPAMRRGEWPNGPTPSTAGPQIGPLRGRVRGSIACWRMWESLRAEPRRGLLRGHRAGRSRVVNYSWVPCLAGSSDTSTSRDDPATLSCLSYRPRQIALKKPRHLPLKVTFEALDDLRQSGHRSLTTGTVSGARDSAVNATLVVP